MSNISNHFKKIQVDTKTLRVGDRYVFHSKKGVAYREPPFSATVESYSVTPTFGGASEPYMVLKDRYQFGPYKHIYAKLTIPTDWIHVSSLDIPCLPEEISRLIQQY